MLSKYTQSETDMYIYTRVIQKHLNFIQILNLSCNSHLCMCQIGPEIKAEIEVRFSSF